MPSKIGPHFQKSPRNFDRWATVCATHKWAQGWGAASNVPPLSLTVGRRGQQAPQDAKALMLAGNSPEYAAQLRFEYHKAGYLADSAIKVWEFDNEITFDNPEQWQWYASYSIAMMKRFESINTYAAIFSFAVGTPELDAWPHLIPAIEYARDNGHYVALHEYMAAEPDLGVGWHQAKWYTDGRPDILRWQAENPNEWFGRKLVNGEPDETYPYGWGVLRYRYVWDQILRPLGLDDTQLLITEFGCDLISFTPKGMSHGSWDDHASFWRSQGFDDAAARYVEMIKWYDWLVREDEFVKGVHLFTVGHVGQWAGFEVADTAVEGLLLDYIEAERGVIDPESPAPETPTPPPPAGEGDCEGLARVPYSRVLVLLPPSADSEWAKAAVSATWDKARYTVSGSADDGGIGGGLKSKTVIVVNPHEWE